MRILYVVTRADAVGGASIHVRDLAREMRRRGHEVIVLVGGRGPVTEQFQAAGVPYRCLRRLRRAVHPIRDLLAAAELLAALREWHPDLVSLHTAKAGWLGRWACARIGIPALYTPHGLAAGGRFSPLASRLFGLAERWAARWDAEIVCTSDYERKLVMAAMPARPERVHVIHNGVQDVGRGLLADPSRSPVRIVSVARFEHPKDHQTLIRALAGLRELDWQLELVGDGPLRGRIQRLTKELELSQRVHFLGYVADPAEVLSRVQLFVLSTRSESFPRSILEAMRAGLPIVASMVGGIPEAIEQEATGLLTSPGDEVALRAALGRLLHDAGLRERLGRQARKQYEARFRFEGVAAETEALYVTVLSGRAILPGAGR